MSEVTDNSESIGEQFKKARDQANLTIEDIANQLHLKSDIIVALETNDFDSLAGPTYIRGYIRSYAKTLKLDPEPLIFQFNQLHAEEKPPEILPKISQHTQISSQDKPVKLFTYLLSFGLVLLLLVWWQGNNVIDPINVDTEDSDDKTPSGVPPAFDYEFDIVIHDEPVLSQMLSLDTELLNIDSSNSSDITESTMTLDPIDSVSDTTDKLSSDSLAVSIQPGNTVIRFIISEDSWIEVNDAEDNRLFINLAKAGEELQVQGKAPLKVLLGNATGVSVNFRGKEFDTAPYERAGIARFTLE